MRVTIKFFLEIRRYDLLCLEGIAQALRIFNGQQEMPTYKLASISRESMIKMHVKPEVIPEIPKYISVFFLFGFKCGSWFYIV